MGKASHVFLFPPYLLVCKSCCLRRRKKNCSCNYRPCLVFSTITSAQTHLVFDAPSVALVYQKNVLKAQIFGSREGKKTTKFISSTQNLQRRCTRVSEKNMNQKNMNQKNMNQKNMNQKNTNQKYQNSTFENEKRDLTCKCNSILRKKLITKKFSLV